MWSHACVGKQGLTPALMLHHVIFLLVSAINVICEVNSNAFPALALTEMSTLTLSFTYYFPGTASKVLFAVSFFLVRICFGTVFIADLLAHWARFSTKMIWPDQFNPHSSNEGRLLRFILSALTPLCATAGVCLNYMWFRKLVLKHVMPAVLEKTTGVIWIPGRKQKVSSARIENAVKRASKTGASGDANTALATGNTRKNNCPRSKSNEANAATANKVETDPSFYRGKPTVQLRDNLHIGAFVVRLALQGDLALGESYVRGDWTPTRVHGEDVDLFRVVRAVCVAVGAGCPSRYANNISLWDSIITFLVREPSKYLMELLFSYLRNLSLSGRMRTFRNTYFLESSVSCARSVKAHYTDESAVIRSLLDQGRVYTSARWPRLLPPYSVSPVTLHEAQKAKIDHILDLGEVQSGTRVLDIGCGWGFLANVAQSRGACALGVCNSSDMVENARKAHITQINHHQLAYEFCDWRDLPLLSSSLPEVDVVTCVEMIEAVPARDYELFAKACWRCLLPGGKVVMQAINAHSYVNAVAKTYEPNLMATYNTTHIFPGQQVPNLQWLYDAFASAGFRRVHVDSNSHNYARTLAHWAHQLEEFARQEHHYDVSTIRKYRYYLATCRAWFDAELLDLADIVWVKI